MGLLAIQPIPWPVGLGVGLLVGPLAALNASWSQLHLAHPSDPLSLGLAGAWWARLAIGMAPGTRCGYSLADDASFYLYLISLLMWITGGWLAWCVLRWRRPLLGLVPGAAAFATNLLNSANQNGYTLVILVLTLALLLWTNYQSSVANVDRAHVKHDRRRALGLLGEWPGCHGGADRARDTAASDVHNRQDGPDAGERILELGRAPGAAQPRGHRRRGSRRTDGIHDRGLAARTANPKARPWSLPTTTSSAAGPRYFRGVDVTQTSNGQWRYPQLESLLGPDRQGSATHLFRDLSEGPLTDYRIDMISAPGGFSDILFYPGTLFLADRNSIAHQSNPPTTPNLSLNAIDRLSSSFPPSSAGVYNVTTQYSIATVAELQKAGTNYPAWLGPYSSLPSSGYRSAAVLNGIHKLALQIVQAANAQTPYDEATAIETYLRTNYKYTLKPPPAPAGTDRLAYFLFTSKQGFCQYFASAMGDLLRSLGIPTQLVNGFGPGIVDPKTGAYEVREEDAHTWVESYFPGYGWITFEPTPDNVYAPINRGTIGPHTCITDTRCDPPPVQGPAPSPDSRPSPVAAGAPGGPKKGGGGGFNLRLPDAGTLTKIIGVLLAIVLLIVLAAERRRYLRAPLGGRGVEPNPGPGPLGRG